MVSGYVHTRSDLTGREHRPGLTKTKDKKGDPTVALQIELLVV